MDPNSLALLMGSAGAAAGPATYVEDVFQTWLYTGNSSTQTITNGVDLAGKGGLVWTKYRSGSFATSHLLVDTVRGTGKHLVTNTAAAEAVASSGVTSFTSTGYTLSNDASYNTSGATYASWTFRKQAKFFDVVTYTGNGTAGRTVAHSLGSTPGCIIVKRTDTTGNWYVYHTSQGNTKYGNLDTTDSFMTSSAFWNNTSPTSTVFTLGSNGDVNGNGGTYVAYLFAHDAGGFGASGNDSVIKCGSFTATGSDVTVDLGWEPQWLLVRSATNADPWYMYDSMRGLTANNSGTTGVYLQANSANAETTSASNAYIPQPTSTGFIAGNSLGWGSGTMIYIAIRRGPMKTPTDATKVFATFNTSVSTKPLLFTTNFAADAVLTRASNKVGGGQFADKLRGGLYLDTTVTDAEGATQFYFFDSNSSVSSNYFNTGFGTVQWLNAFRRAPGFFDVVAYTGTGANRTVSHNLGVAPELMIIKRRSGTGTNWFVYNSTIGATKAVFLDSDYGPALQSTNYWNDTSPTSSVFTVGTDTGVNQSTGTFIAYLFASCPGVSKVGSYTGTGTTLSIDCGFTNGARFVLIKRTDSNGDWYVWDTARGIIAANDPFLLLNSTAAEVTNTDYIDPLSSGFQISSTAPAAINANGGSFIYLAIA